MTSITPRRPANRLGLDYRAEASRLGPPPVPMTDVHTHISGTDAARIYRDVCDLYGIARTCSMTHLEEVETLREIFGPERIRFIAAPNYASEDKRTAFTTDWPRRIEAFAEAGARVCKFWAAPRSRDYEREFDLPGHFAIDSEHRRETMRIARDCGMMFMTHIADPDTWFAAKYRDASFYGTKREHHDAFERMLEEFDDVPWLAAHMGGSPEDLDFLDGLLERHDHLHLDTSATKWMVRELSRHPSERFAAFCRRWKGRILFGSDIVTFDQHVNPPEDPAASPYARLAAGPEEAFELYASRYWALRTMFESRDEGESPIADPDLHMVDPERYDEMDAPMLRGHALDRDLLESIYRDAAVELLDRWHADHP